MHANALGYIALWWSHDPWSDLKDVQIQHLEMWFSVDLVVLG